MRASANPILVLAACVFCACGSGGPGADTRVDAIDVPDVPADVPPIDAPEVPADVAPLDAPTDAQPVDVLPDIPACTWNGTVPQDPLDPAQKKFALSMFHFNMQYVAGGLITQWNGQPVSLCDDLGFDPTLCDGFDDDHLNDWDIDVGFAPTLDLYLKHPDWKTTFEIPGIMMERIGEHHPDVLAKLVAAAQSGQVEVVSFHWSAQLFMAFPALDLERSLDLARAVFAKYCIPLSNVVFAQEGQDGEGKHAFMATHGLTIDLMHENQFGYVQRGVPVQPLYRSHGVDVVVGPPLIDGNADLDPASGIEVAWTFFDDGELLSVPGDPYLAMLSPTPDEGNLATYEAKVLDLVSRGYKVTHLTDYVRQLHGQNVATPDLPPFIEGTWQPIDTDGIHQWLGRKGKFAWSSHERDNFIRTGNTQASQGLKALEVLVDAAAQGGIDTAVARAQVAAAWRDLLMAEVSDATGINPFQGEFVYGRDHNAAAVAIVDAQKQAVLAALGWPHAEIDVASGTAVRLETLPGVATPVEVAAPLLATVDANARTAKATWYQGGSASEWILKIDIGPSSDATGDDVTKRTVTVTFPRTEDKVILTPALDEGRVSETPFTAFHFHADADYPSKEPDIYIPASNGLVGLGGGWWVIRDNRSVMIAPRIPVRQPIVQFIDETADPAGPPPWVFHVVQGTADQALQVATRLNLKPLVDW